MTEGSFTGETYTEFIRERLIPQCTPWPGPRSVLIMDNCAIHKKDELLPLCAEAGVILLFLPPYSPDYNPIEYSFAEFKRLLRRGVDCSADEIFDYIDVAMQKVNEADNATAYFQRSGIRIPS